jgi:hypothetical protein
VPLGTDAKSRQLCRDAGLAWWTKHRDQVDLAKLGAAQALLGYTLLTQMDPRASD